MGIAKLGKKLQYFYELEMAKRIYMVLPDETESKIKKRIFKEIKPEKKWNFYDVTMVGPGKHRDEAISTAEFDFLYGRVIKAIACIYANGEAGLDNAVKDFCVLKGSSRGYEKKMLEDVSKLLNFSENTEILDMVELAYKYESKMYRNIEKNRRLFHSKPREVRENLLIAQQIENMKDEGCSKEAIEDAVEMLNKNIKIGGTRHDAFSRLRNDLYLDLAIENLAENYPESFEGVNLDFFRQIVTTRGLNGIYKEANSSQAEDDDSSEK